MKKIFHYSVLLWCFCYSCEEAPIGQTAVDSIPPSPVSNLQVINTPGGALISYILPEDEDLLYVKAVYKLKDGSIAECRASVYTDTLKLQGLGDTLYHDVELTCVDRSNNQSETKSVRIKPLLPPVYAIFESLKIIEDFGGVQLSWNNLTEANISVVLLREVQGEYVHLDALYRNQKSVAQSIRGLKARETKFAAFVRDRWNNLSDTLFVTLLPLFEMKIPYDMIKPYPLPDDQPSAWGWVFGNLWDNNANTGFHTAENGIWPQHFTFQFTKAVKISRLKVYQRLEMTYGHANPKKFELWGSNNPSLDGSFDSWTIIGDYESYKPSGLPVGQLGNEDVKYISNGEEFSVSASTPSYKYLRIKVKETWAGFQMLHIMELPFWGCPEGYVPTEEDLKDK